MIFALPLYDDNPVQRPPVVTWTLIGLCVGAYLWQLGQNENAVAYGYGLIPARLMGAQLPPWIGAAPPALTIFTSMFLHSGLLHLGGNMLFLWIFGNNIEDLLGPARYLLLYFGSGVAAAMTQVLPDPTSDIPMVGASGAIAGVLGAYVMIYPRANVNVFVWIIIFFRIVAVPAWLMLGFWFGMQLLSAVSTSANEPGVAFWAHAGGFVAGVVLVLLLRPRRVELLQPQKSPFFATVPPNALAGRRTFHRGSVPQVGRRQDPWGR